MTGERGTTQAIVQQHTTLLAQRGGVIHRGEMAQTVNR